MTQPFSFLRGEWFDIHESASQAASLAYADPRAACFHARRALELIVKWIYKADPALRCPPNAKLSELIHDPSFRAVAAPEIFPKAVIINKLGNRAVHEASFISAADSKGAVTELFHIGYWMARTYARMAPPPAGLRFDVEALPRTTLIDSQTLADLQKLAQSLAERDRKIVDAEAENAETKAEIERLRAEIAEAKRASAERPDTHDYSESETRDRYIDLLLSEAGWDLTEDNRECRLTFPDGSKGRADYVLWNDDGKPLAVVEAKRARIDANAGREQAKRYADALEQEHGQRPVIFYSNGYEHWIWDDAHYPPRRVQGFYKKDELDALIQRRATRESLVSLPLNKEIADRFYQERALRRVGEAFEQSQRKALLVMATGTGKTRTVVSLVDLLERARWIKRVLFLADRRALVKQAAKAFTAHLPNAAPVNLAEEKDKKKVQSARVVASTYPTMLGLIEETPSGVRDYGVGHFDLVIIDEAHRSVFQKYRAIFEHFDALLVGLTATPKDEIDRNTYSLFELEDGMPTDAYGLEEAVKDKFLVPFQAVSVPLKFQREGITYDQLSDEEKAHWDEVEWSDDGTVPDRVEAEALNRWLFNKSTVDKVLEHLMERGLKVEGHNRLGKTILFAKNQAHAEFIKERFDVHYPHYKGEFASVITAKTERAEALLEDFGKKDKMPHLAISVDMLDTGIDVPEVVNLVFFKTIRSPTKFWQMIGRGTRLCPDLHGPGEHKAFFYVFDFCQNLEFFKENPATVDGAVGTSTRHRSFTRRLELIGELDQRLPAERDAIHEDLDPYGDPRTDSQIRRALSEGLRAEVGAMNVDNFLVRPHRRLVEKYSRPGAWALLSDQAREELQSVAGLPSAAPSDTEEARRFDLLIYGLELTVLRTEPKFTQLRDQTKAIAEGLMDKGAIPMVKEQMPLIEEVKSDGWWEDVTLPMLEQVRRRLRGLVGFIDKQKRVVVYTDFEDELGPEQTIELPGFEEAAFAKFRARVRTFLRAHLDHLAIHKVRTNRPLTPADLASLESMLAESGEADPKALEHAKEQAQGLGLFVRSLVGLDREAAKEALGGFLGGRSLRSQQIEFVNLIVNHLTEHGVMDAGLLYESPFTDLAPQGPDQLFGAEEVDRLVKALERVTATAAA